MHTKLHAQHIPYTYLTYYTLYILILCTLYTLYTPYYIYTIVGPPCIHPGGDGDHQGYTAHRGRLVYSVVYNKSMCIVVVHMYT